MKNISSIFFGSLFLMLVCISCNNGSGDKMISDADTVLSDANRIDSLTAEKKNKIDFKFSTTTINLPSPFEVVNDLYNYEAPFKGELLNPTSNMDNYNKTFKKEVNFGIYGIDLAYVNFYSQNQETINYYSTIQKLGEELSIDKVFNLYAERYQENSRNHDSVVAIVDDIFNETDLYLKKNDRYLVASHILAGALIEVNYLSLNLLKEIKKTPSNEHFFERIYNENRGIYHLISLLEEYNDKDSKDLTADLKVYKNSYDEAIKSPDDLSTDKINKAIEYINTIRNKLIK